MSNRSGSFEASYTMLSAEVEDYEDATTSTAPAFSPLGLGRDAASSTAPYTPDPHDVSETERQSYYAGLPSAPKLLYRTGKERWFLFKGFYPSRRLKELCEVFTHPITKVWDHDLGWRVVKVMDAHKILFTTIDVVRFKRVDEDPEDPEDEDFVKVSKSPLVGPVTIWIGVFPGSTSATAAHNAAQEILALLKDYQITDVDIDFRESHYRREAGRQLLKMVDELDPLTDVVGPLTPALGLYISTKARPESQGTMALYLAEGGGSDRLLGLTCRHVLIGSQEANIEYVHHPSRPSKDVLLLGVRAFTNLVDLIKLKIEKHDYLAKRWREQIEVYKGKEKDTNPVRVDKAKADRIEAQGFLNKAEKATKAFGAFRGQVIEDWKKLDNRVLGHILRAPAIRFGVGKQRFTEDWGIFEVNRSKLGDGFEGNKIDLGTMPFALFQMKCYPRGDDNWKFKYPIFNRLLPLNGIITDNLMYTPDMWDKDGEPCLMVIKNGNATDTTIGRANGVFSIVREYFPLNMSIHQTSMEWGIINYGITDVFSEPGDSGSVVADIRGRIGGIITGGSGKAESTDMTYATPFWWLLERIKANGFPNAHLDVFA